MDILQISALLYLEVCQVSHFQGIRTSQIWLNGKTAGHARTIHEDGIQIPLCKLYSRNTLNTAVFKVRASKIRKLSALTCSQVIERNSRKPDFTRSDLIALVAATRIAARRIKEMCDRFGTDAYENALDILLTRNKLAVGKIIKTTLSSEKVHFEDYIDDDGHGTGPWRVAW